MRAHCFYCFLNKYLVELRLTVFWNDFTNKQFLTPTSMLWNTYVSSLLPSLVLLLDIHNKELKYQFSWIFYFLSYTNTQTCQVFRIICEDMEWGAQCSACNLKVAGSSPDRIVSNMSSFSWARSWTTILL